MNNAIKLLVFVLGISGAFVYICNAIPQIESRPVEEVTIGSSPEELVAAGKTILQSDRAQCLTCHALGEDPKARCPNLQGLGEQAAGRTSLSAAEYLVQSVYDPNAFIVSGFPKNQMTPVNRPPIALSDEEILAVTAYLNSLGGDTDEGFVELLRQAQGREDLITPTEGADEVNLPIFPGNVEAGLKIFQEDKQACSKCHRVGTEGAEVGPELTAIGASQSGEYILESLIDPSAVIVKGYKQLIVLLDDGSDVRGTPTAWLPDKEHPRTLRLGVLEGTEVKEMEIDLTQVVSVGDTIVGVEREGELLDLCGEYVEGDEKTGITLRILKDEGWVEERFSAEELDFVNLPMSPMPENIPELLTPQQMYDLVAYLLAQKEKEVGQ